jgi:uncharacterized membrane protein YebE (DUF533 family)
MKNPGPFMDQFLGHSAKGGMGDPYGGKPGADPWQQQQAWPQKQVSQPWPQQPPEPVPSPAEQEAIRRKKMAAAQPQGGMLDRARDMMGMGAGGAVGAAAGGGLLGALFGRGSVGRSVLTHGGSAALGALAYRAWQSWQAGRSGQAAAPAAPAAATPVPAAFAPGATPARGGEPFELALIRVMVAAAKADGHIDAAERGRIFEAVERSTLDAEQKGFVFTLLTQDITVEQIAASAAGQEQATQIWLAARMVLELDHAAERAFLDALGARLALPAELVAQLERQVQEATRPPTTA